MFYNKHLTFNKKWLFYLLFLILFANLLNAPVTIHENKDLIINNEPLTIGDNSQKILSLQTLFPHPPIVINGNPDLIAQTQGAGCGSQLDPCIIANYSINASGMHGIDISNTDLYFRIENVLVGNASAAIDGIHFQNVINGHITNTTVKGTSRGFVFMDSNALIIDNNIADSNNFEGFIFLNINNSIIKDNLAKTNIAHGFFFSDINNTIVQNNSAIDNNQHGFYLLKIDFNNTFLGNSGQGNGIAGIYLEAISTNTILADNQLFRNQYGIWLSDSSNIMLIRNVAYNNSIDGYLLDFNSNNNLLEFNNASHNSNTGWKFDGTNNNILNNSFSNFNRIFVQNSVNTIINNLQIIGDNISVMDSPFTNITNNVIKDIVSISSSSSTSGLFVDNSPNSSIINNLVTNVNNVIPTLNIASRGIYVLNSDNVSIIANNINKILAENAIDNSFAIGIEVTGKNVLITNNSINNLVSDGANAETYGIFLQNATNSMLLDNSISALSASSTISFIYLSNSNSTSLSVEAGLPINVTWTNPFLVSYNFSLSFLNNSLLDNQSWTAASHLTLSLSNLATGLHNYTISINDASMNSVTDTVWIVIRDTIFPLITNPPDITYGLGTTGNQLSWVATDANPDSYSIYQDGILKDSNQWFSGTPITTSIDGLPLGIYNFTIVVVDLTSFSTEDTVFVTVIDSPPPNITSPNDFSYDEEGLTSENITWVITDSNPANYIVFFNETVIQEGIWTSINLSIFLDVSGLRVGFYNYTVLVSNSFGSSAADTVLVTVIDTISPYIRGPFNFHFHQNSVGNDITWYVSDANPGNFSIEINEISIINGSWKNSPWITVIPDDLTIGIYNITLILMDNYNNTAIDTVMVTVLLPESGNETETSAGGFDFNIDPTIIAGAGLIVVASGGVIIIWRRR